MKAEFWVVLTAKKSKYGPEPKEWESDGVPTVRMNKPATRADQVAVKIVAEVPDTYFEKPQLQATIRIPEGGKARQEIVAEMQAHAAQDLRERFGIEVSFTEASV